MTQAQADILQIRKRQDGFPFSNGSTYEHKQPSCLAHVGLFIRKSKRAVNV